MTTATPSNPAHSRRPARRGRRRTLRARDTRTIGLPRQATPSSEAARPSRGFELGAFLRQVSEVLVRLERGARELRSVADSASQVLELTRDAGSESVAAAARLRERAFRLHKTGAMLAQLVFGYRLFGLRTAFASRDRASEVLAQLHADNAARFRETSLEQGGAFLKVGQLLSARADMLPNVWIRELAPLQDAVPPLTAAETREALYSALGAEPEQFFQHFDWQPLAAASIGQVHRARTLAGDEVAVKLQRPGIAERIDDDLSLLSLSCEALRASLPPLDLDTITRQISAHVRAEVDYEREALLGTRVAEFFASVPGVCAPEPLPALCRPELLTMRFVPGRKLTLVLDELSAAREAGDTEAHARISQLLGRLLEAYLRQMFQLGTFQADPHPGNLLVTDADELVILDFGCAGELTREHRAAYLRLLLAFFAGDRAASADAFATLGFRTQSGKPDALIDMMQNLLGELAQAVVERRVDWPDRAALTARLQRLGQLSAADPIVTIPEHFVLIGRVLSTVTGLFAHYRPELDVAAHVLPVLAVA